MVASVIVYLAVLDMGLGNAVVRYTSKYRALGDKEGEYVKWNGYIIGLIAGVIGFTL